MVRIFLALLTILALASGCARKRPVLEDLVGREDLSSFKIHSVTGVRDGDKLSAQVLISDSSSILTLDLHFAIGSPTTLASGTWQWSRSSGRKSGLIAANSITFLGGQDDGPSIGGTFELTGTPNSYRVNLPLTVLPRVIKQRNP